MGSALSLSPARVGGPAGGHERRASGRRHEARRASNRFTSRQLPRLSARPSSGVHRSRPQQTTRPAANHGEPAASERTVSLSFISHVDARFNEGDSGVSCDGCAANAGARWIRFAEYQIHIRGVATLPHDNLRRILAKTLQYEGHTVRVAKTLRSARGQLERGSVDIVLSEMRLSTAEEGLQVLELSNRLSPRPLVIFTTASGGVSSAVKALKTGAHDYLMKPFATAELLSAVECALGELNRNDVFICHASGNKRQFVYPFIKSLKAKHVTFWIDEAEISWGDSITDKISEGLLAARYVVVFLTAAFLRRRWPATELKAALRREVESGDTIVLPVLAGDPKKIFQTYPLLKNKAYARWSDGPNALADRMRELLARRKNARHASVSGGSRAV
ncbi:MAG: hypothetical protein DMF60_20070 [Acidobacteria bacterium]|nr:MAG: hypothetical protein DMF60_20070 [Acidobacteriota bacterium]